MPTQESQIKQLIAYIKKNITKGYTADALKYSLMQQGYSRTSVEKALEMANKEIAQSVPKMQEKPVITYSFDEDDLKQKMAANDANEGFFKKLKRKFFG